jgi:hypothetical protein
MWKSGMLFLVSASVLWATTVCIPPGEGIATMVVPDAWKTTVRGEVTETSSADHQVHLIVLRVERRKVADVMGEVMTYIRNSGGISVRANSMQRSTQTVKGHVAQVLSWRAADKNGDIEIDYVVFSSGPEATWLAASWGEPRALQKRRSEVDRMIGSVTPASDQRHEAD